MLRRFVGWKSGLGAACGLAALLASGAAQAGLEDGRYGAAQVFDVQRSPAFPQAGVSFTASNMTTPYRAVTSTQYTLNPGEYIRFIRQGVGDNPCSFEIRRYAADNTDLGQIAAGGPVYGLANEGFLHVSTPGDFGTFVANSAGYANGDSATFTTPIAGATCAQAASYAANTTAISTPTPPAQNGACAVSSVPSVAAPGGVSACTAGTQTNLASTAGSHTWDCDGVNGGTAATACSRPRGYSVTASLTGGGGGVTPSGTQVVAYNDTATFALQATGGRVLGTASGCSGSLTGTLLVDATGSYTTGPVAASCTASFSFALNAAPTAGSLAIADGAAATPGVPLTGSYIYQDTNNDAEGASQLLWKRAASAGGPATPIAGASGAQYTPVDADGGQYLFFCVTAVAASGTATGAEMCVATSAPVRINGSCGTATTLDSATVPASDLCTAGTPGPVSVLGGRYTWACQGQMGGSNSGTCEASWAPTGAGPLSTVAPPVSADGWVVASAVFSGTPPAAPPTGTQFPAGILALQLSSGTAGSSASVTVHYSQPVPAGAVYLKYGRSPPGLNCQGATCAQPHWYTLPAERAVFASDRLSVTLTLQDGGVGDGDALANSWIDDPGGPALLPPANPTAIPTLSEWAMLLLSLALGACAFAVLRRRRV